MVEYNLKFLLVIILQFKMGRDVWFIFNGAAFIFVYLSIILIVVITICFSKFDDKNESKSILYGLRQEFTSKLVSSVNWIALFLYRISTGILILSGDSLSPKTRWIIMLCIHLFYHILTSSTIFCRGGMRDD